jgi:hypothetical protein
MLVTVVPAALALALAAVSGAQANRPAASAGRPVALAALWAPPAGATRRARRRPPAPAGRAAPTPNGKSTEALEQEVFGGEATPQVRRAPARPKHDSSRDNDNDNDGDGDGDGDGDARADGEGDDDPDGGGARGDRHALGSLAPVVAPHLVAFSLGTSLIGRSFSFDGPQQPDSGFREGLVAAVESFPLLAARRWFARLGVGASFGTEVGSAGMTQPDGGTLSYPVTERRWALDVRYALPFGPRFLLVPRFGYGHSSYDLGRRAQPAPSTCTATSTLVCVPDVEVAHLTIGADARFAITPALAISLGAAFLPAFGVGRGMGQLAVESPASARGFSADLAVTWQILDWLALRAALPVERYGYQFDRRPLSYTSASETYYGLVAGAVVFAR